MTQRSIFTENQRIWQKHQHWQFMARASLPSVDTRYTRVNASLRQSTLFFHLTQNIVDYEHTSLIPARVDHALQPCCPSNVQAASLFECYNPLHAALNECPPLQRLLSHYSPGPQAPRAQGQRSAASHHACSLQYGTFALA